MDEKKSDKNLTSTKIVNKLDFSQNTGSQTIQGTIKPVKISDKLDLTATTVKPNKVVTTTKKTNKRKPSKKPGRKNKRRRRPTPKRERVIRLFKETSDSINDDYYIDPYVSIGQRPTTVRTTTKNFYSNYYNYMTTEQTTDYDTRRPTKISDKIDKEDFSNSYSYSGYSPTFSSSNLKPIRHKNPSLQSAFSSSSSLPQHHSNLPSPFFTNSNFQFRKLFYDNKTDTWSDNANSKIKTNLTYQNYYNITDGHFIEDELYKQLNLTDKTYADKYDTYANIDHYWDLRKRLAKRRRLTKVKRKNTKQRQGTGISLVPFVLLTSIER